MRLAALLLALTLAPIASAQWILQDPHTTADLRGIDSLGNGVAWASGTDGTVLRTEDAGFVWQLCAIPPGAEKLDFRGVQAFDNNTALVMSSGKGDLSRLYKTTDGCQTWTLLFTNPDKDGFWDALRFSDRDTGWLLGDPVNGSFSLFATRDNGDHWTRRKDPSSNANSSAQGAFAASNSSLQVIGGWAVYGTGGTTGAAIYGEAPLVQCTNCGRLGNADQGPSKTTWIRKEIPVGSGTEASGIFSLGVGKPTTGPPLGNSLLVIVGGDYSKPEQSTGTAAYYDFGIKHWTASQTPPHGYRSAVAYDPTHNTWITVGPNGTDISADDGRNWRPLKPDPKFNDPPDADQHWNALSLPFVVGPHGRIGTLRQDALPGAKK